MAAFNFPNSPSDGDTHTENGLTYVWDGTNGAWKRSPASLSKGVKGDKGDAGTDGDKGSKGDNKGEQGDKGEPGDVTAKGAKGEPGDKGDEGNKGDKGDVEAQGNKGDEGQKGEPGDKGDEGVKGETGSTGAGMAVGGIVAWSGSASSLPDGYFLCDGSAKSRTTYDALYTVIGTTHGAGDGSTTFNLPDLSGRFVVGYDSNNNIFDVADKGGSADATLVAHGHTINDPGHFHTTVDYVARSGYAEPRNFGVGTDGNANNTGNTNSKTTGITINSNGSSATNANLPPYYALAYIIQYAQGGDVAKGQKGEAGSDGTNGTDGDKGQKGEAGADNSTKGQKGEAGSGGGDSVWETTSAGINTSSNVGIGTNLSGSNTHLLHLFNGTGCGTIGAGVGEFVVESNNAATIQLLSPSNAAIPQTIYFGDESSGQIGRIQYDHSDDSMLFKTNGNNRRFRLNSSGDADFTGNIGIGTDLSGSGTHVLHVYRGTGCGSQSSGIGEVVIESNNAATIQLLSPSSASGDINPQTIYFGDESSGDSGRIQYSHSSDSMIFKTNGNNERIRITSTGQLNLAGDMQFTAANPELEFNNGGPRFRVPAANTLAIHNGGGLGSTNNEVVRISQSGNVGIGTTNPDAAIGTQNNTKLAVAGIVTAFKYYGDGSNLTGISGGGGSSDPVGTIVAWVGSIASIPNEYQLCDGSTPVTSQLQTLLGSGVNVPDLRDRFIIGANDVAAESAYPGVGIGSTGGSADAVVVEHKHTTSFDGKKYFPGGGSTNIGYGGAGSYPADTFSMDNEGVSGTNKNLPPYYALCYIIKHTATSGSGGNSQSGTTKVALLKDQKNQGVNGGSFSAFGWKDRDLTVEEDPSNFVDFTAGGSQSSGSSGNTPGYWSLPAGTYKIEWSCSGNDVNRHKSRLVYSTTQSQISTAGLDASALFVEGSSENTSSSSTATDDYPASSISVGYTVITLTQTTWFKILQYCTTSNTTHGFGRPVRGAGISDLGPEIYSQVRIEDLATAVKDVGTTKIAVLRDEKTSGTDGGQYSAGVWHTRDLNVQYDSFSFVSLSSNVFSMAAGDYKINWSAPALHVDYFQTRIAYTTDSTFSSGINYYYGSSAYSGETGTGGGNYSDSVDQSLGEYLSSTTATTYYRIEQKISTSEGTADFGAGTSMGIEVYLQVSIEDLSTALKSGVTIGDKIEEGNTKAEVVDTGTDGKFVVTTEGVERIIVDPSGYLNARADIRLRRTSTNDGGLYFGDSNNNYIFGSDDDDVLTFATNGTERLRIGQTGVTTSFLGTNNSDSFNIQGNASQSRTTFNVIAGNADSNGSTSMRLTRSNGNQPLSLFIEHDSDDGNIMNPTQGGSLIFHTNASGSSLEKMRITSSGLVAIKSTGQLINESGLGVRSAGNTCVLKAEGNINHNALICWNNSGSGSSNRSQIAFGDGTSFTSHGTIYTNGSNVVYGGQSDYRLKQDEVLITDGIEKVKLLKPRRFKWKSNLDLGMCDGFFAHEIEETTPASQATIGAKDAVATESDVNVGLAKSIGDPIYQQIDQSKLIPILTAALKEAIAKIETLETKVAALEG